MHLVPSFKSELAGSYVKALRLFNFYGFLKEIVNNCVLWNIFVHSTQLLIIKMFGSCF